MKKLLWYLVLSLALSYTALACCRNNAKAPPTSSQVVQYNFSPKQSVGISVSVSYKTPQTSANLNTIIIGWKDPTSTINISTVIDTRGNTYTLAIGPTRISGSIAQAIYYAKNIAAGSNAVSVTFSAQVLDPDVNIREYRNLDTISPLDVVAQNTGSGISATSGTATTTSAAEIIVGAGISAQTPNKGFTAIETGFGGIIDAMGNVVEDRLVTSIGNYKATASSLATANWVMQMVTFKLSNAVPAVPALSAGLVWSLTWTEATAGVSSYTLYKSSVSGGPYTLLASGLTGNSAPVGQEDLLQWLVMDTRRYTEHLNGTWPFLSPNDDHGVPGQTWWWIKSSPAGNPWDIDQYDSTNLYFWITENGDQDPTNPSAYKRFVTPVPLAPRFFSPGTTITIDTAAPNNIKRTINCEVDNQTPFDLGHIRGVTTGPTPMSWGGDVGTADTIIINYYWGGSGSTYNTREREFLVKFLGRVSWDTAHWNGSAYVIDASTLHNTLQTGSTPTPNFTCGYSQSWWPTTSTQSSYSYNDYVASGTSNYYVLTATKNGVTSGYSNEIPGTSVSCGPPLYSCSRNDTNIVQTPNPPPSVGGSTGVNTIVTDPDFHNRILRATDANTRSGNTDMSVAVSGGDGDVIWNSDETMFVAVNSGNNCVLGLNTGTFQITNPVATHCFAGGWSWSHTNPQVGYHHDNTTTQIKKVTCTSASSCSETLFYDFAASCTAISPTIHVAPGQLEITADDQEFSMVLGGTGLQDTANFIVTYRVGSGCRAWRTDTGAITGEWGTTGTATSSCRFLIHDDGKFLSPISPDPPGAWERVSLVGTGISGCTVSGSNGIDLWWHISDTTVNVCTPACGGHANGGYTHFINVNNPTYEIRSLTTIGSPIALMSYPASPGETHLSWNDADTNDTVPPIAGTSTINGTWGHPYFNEIFAVFPTPNVAARRFAHCFQTGTSTQFRAKNCILSVSPGGHYVGFSSDWLGTLGGRPSDVFILELR